MEKILSCTGLSKYYGGLPALSDVSVNLFAGRVTCLAGGSGAGKTTLLRLAAGHIHPTEGSLRVGGIYPSAAVNEFTAYLPDRDFLPEDDRLIDLVRFYNAMFSDFGAEKAIELLNGMRADITKRFGCFSRSMRAGIQAALIASRSPRLFLLDEPLLGADRASRKLIFDEIFGRVKDGAAVILASPELDREPGWEHIDDILLLKNGTVAYCGALADMPAEERSEL